MKSGGVCRLYIHCQKKSSVWEYVLQCKAAKHLKQNICLYISTWIASIEIWATVDGHTGSVLLWVAEWEPRQTISHTFHSYTVHRWPLSSSRVLLCPLLCSCLSPPSSQRSVEFPESVPCILWAVLERDGGRGGRERWKSEWTLVVEIRGASRSQRVCTVYANTHAHKHTQTCTHSHFLYITETRLVPVIHSHRKWDERTNCGLPTHLRCLFKQSLRLLAEQGRRKNERKGPFRFIHCSC